MYDEAKKIKKSKQNENQFNTENLLDISEIRNNVVILKDWWLRSIIKVFWLNLDLRNYDEQQVVIEQYKRFINWLDFSIQILARSTYLDLTDYISFIEEKIDGIENDVLKRQGKEYYNYLEKINSNQWLIYTKEFYVIIPYYHGANDTQEISKPWWKKLMDVLDSKENPEKVVSRYRNFVKNKKHLDVRTNIVEEWLKWIWLFCEKLDINEIVSLLFKVNNPNSHKEQS